MTKNDDALIAPGDLCVALALLSRLPVDAQDMSRTGRSVWAYPLVGFLVSALAGFVGILALKAGIPEALAALLTLFVLIVSTGAMHEDGLADTADGLWGAPERDRRLEIMKDSRIGAYGVIALILSLLARWTALWLLFTIDTTSAVLALFVVGMVSRATMPVLMYSLSHARQNGLSHSVGEVPASSVGLSIGIAIISAFLLVGGAAFWAAICAGGTTLILGIIAKNKIGGQTGDILGATQQASEIVALFCLVATLV